MRFLLAFFVICSATSLGAEEPWGKDADLAGVCLRPSESCYTGGALSKSGQGMIRFYQSVISPSNGPRSSFVPSSSQYTLDAMQKYGFVWGVLYGCDRLMRENADPWIYPRCLNHEGFDLKWDPVR